MNRFAVGMLGVLVAILLPSCMILKKGGKKKKEDKTEKTADRGVTDPAVIAATLPDSITALPDPNGAMLTMLAPLYDRRINYRTFSGRAKVSMQSADVSADFSVNIRMAKDSLVWLHVTALGGLYPVAKMLVTRDSFFMVDHTHKQVTMLPLADVGKVLPISVQLWQLQNLLVGDPLSNSKIVAAEQKDSLWTLRTQDTSYTQQLSYSKIDSNMLTGNLETLNAGGPRALLTYGRYEMVGSRKLSVSRTVNVQNGINIYNLEMDIVNPEFDKELDYSFSVPKNYTVKAMK
jgi:hypothetical protein